MSKKVFNNAANDALFAGIMVFIGSAVFGGVGVLLGKVVGDKDPVVEDDDTTEDVD